MSSRKSEKMGENLASESDLLSMIHEVGLQHFCQFIYLSNISQI